jgi:hypothetical protein
MKSMSSMLKDNLSAVNLQITYDATPFCARVIHPGLPPESIGLDGKLTFCKILFQLSCKALFCEIVLGVATVVNVLQRNPQIRCSSNKKIAYGFTSLFDLTKS